ncbi:hypothetical protein F5Y04DRAFT_277913 [Hypomontagnella monticulosa]|nr:hypothetical protein F5Y04DRAFT_277913 [Hypomontagnella monticulosa]
MSESMKAASGDLSDWNAEPVLVQKDPEEDVPGANITYLKDVHEHLSHPDIGSYSKFGLKHGYWAVGVHPDDREYFAFSVSGFPLLRLYFDVRLSVI